MRGCSRAPIDGDGNIIRFRPHGTDPRSESSMGGCHTTGESPVEDLRKYEYTSESNDNYRHRMLVNFFATIVIIVLMVTGTWMVDTIISSWPKQ
jgi:hypothetical protein